MRCRFYSVACAEYLGGTTMTIIDVLSLYTKDYLANNIFEQWVYQNEQELSKSFDDSLYYEIISTDYDNKGEVVNLKTKLDKYLEYNYTNEFNNINDSYIDKVIDSTEIGNPIIKLLKERYGRKEEVEFDCINISSSRELHEDIKEKFGFSQYYGMNWDALRDFLRETELPKKIIFNGWSHLVKVMPKDSNILKSILEEYATNDTDIIYK